MLWLYLFLLRYSHSNRRLCNQFIHLTNYSVNKKNADFVQNSDKSVCQGHKWSVHQDLMRERASNCNACTIALNKELHNFWFNFGTS